MVGLAMLFWPLEIWPLRSVPTCIESQRIVLKNINTDLLHDTFNKNAYSTFSLARGVGEISNFLVGRARRTRFSFFVVL